MAKVERTYHDNGAIAAESPQTDGIPDGIVHHWHPNGALAMEIPMDHGVINGIVKQWNDKGELLATSELKHGTGVLRTLNPEQGLDGEITYVGGKQTGRQLCYSGGDLMAVVYWLENKKVSRKRYDEACKQNPSLPQYDDDHKLGRTWLQKMSKVEVAKPSTPRKVGDELPVELLQGPRVREALSWLEESRQPSRSVGEATGQDESIRLVKELYSLGALRVHAVEIDGKADEDQNTGRVVVELPQDKQQRENLLKFCGELASAAGFDPDQDAGQRYVLLMLD